MLVTIGALVVAVAIRCAYVITVRRHRSAWVRRERPGSCLYLDKDNARDIYLQEDKYPDLQRSVQETTRRKRAGKVKVQPSSVGADVTAANDREQVIKYIKDEGEITVIGRIIRALDDANDIVYVDLFKRTLGPNTGLDQALVWHYGRGEAKRVRTARLSKLDPGTFVSVMGRFRVTAESETTMTFSAPYGDSAESSADQPAVSFTCVKDQLRRDVPDDAFTARCLGKIDGWESSTRQLVISPVYAIFR